MRYQFQSFCRRTIAAAVMSVLMVGSSSAATPTTSPDPLKSIDLDQNGITSIAEFDRYVRSWAAKNVTLNADKNGDGRIDKEEFAIYDKEFDKQVEEIVADALVNYKARVKNRPEPTVTEVTRLWPVPSPPPPQRDGIDSPQQPFLLRLSKDEFDKELDQAEPAIVSYSRNFDTNADVWHVHGAGLFRYRAPDHTYALGGTVEFDRVTNDVDPTKEVNSLTPRFQSAFRVAGDKPFGLHEFRLNAAYATDFDFHSKVPAAEFEYEPTFRLPGNNVKYSLNGIFDFRYRMAFKSEYGRVVDAGDNPDLAKIENEDFLRLGGMVQLEIWPTLAGLERVGLSFQYEHFNDVLNDNDGLDLFSAKALYNLDEDGHYALTIEYRSGQTTLLKQDTNALSVGFGIKF